VNQPITRPPFSRQKLSDKVELCQRDLGFNQQDWTASDKRDKKLLCSLTNNGSKVNLLRYFVKEPPYLFSLNDRARLNRMGRL
jgi:hypothetical protein